MNKPPCKGCPDRHVGCHGECEAYIEYDKSRQEARQKRMEECDVRYVSYTGQLRIVNSHNPRHVRTWERRKNDT